VVNWKTKKGRLNKVLVAGESITIGQAVAIYTDGKVYKADADAEGYYPAVGLAGFSVSEGDKVEIVRGGVLYDSTATWTIGGEVYLSETAGGLVQIAPTVAQLIGYALTATTIAVEIAQITGDLGSGSVSNAHINASAGIVGSKLHTNAQVRYAKSEILNIDIGAGTPKDTAVLVPEKAITITDACFVYTEATAAAGATAATIKMGTSAGGTQIVNTTNLQQPKAIGSKTALSIVSGKVTADGAVFVRLTGVVATPIAGEGYIQIEYTVDDAA